MLSGTSGRKLAVASLALFAVITGSAAYEFLKAAIFSGLDLPTDLGAGWSLLIGAVAAAMTIGLGIATFDQAKPLLRSRATILPETAGRRSIVLIMTLSALGTREKPDEKLRNALRLVGALPSDNPKAAEELLDHLCCSDNKDGKTAPFANWPWQQPLRLVRYHRARLQRVLLVLSTEANANFEDFKRLVRPFINVGCRVELVGQPLNLEDYNALEMAIHEAFNGVKATFDERDICIDITGGLKPWSVVAAMAALNTEAFFSYVQTRSPFRVLMYDAKLIR